MSVNADPKVINNAAGALINSFVSIYNETILLNSELQKFGQTLDDEAYSNISSKIGIVISKMENSQEMVNSICKKLIQYAKEIGISQKSTEDVL